MSDTKERRLKITPGKSTSIADSSVLGRYSVWAGDKPMATTTLRTDISEEQAAANASLYADAHNTANEVDMLPSELLAKLREAVVLLEKCKGWAWRCYDIDVSTSMQLAAKSHADQAESFLSTLNLPK